MLRVLQLLPLLINNEHRDRLTTSCRAVPSNQTVTEKCVCHDKTSFFSGPFKRLLKARIEFLFIFIFMWLGAFTRLLDGDWHNPMHLYL
jgi:hypothetical protein